MAVVLIPPSTVTEAADRVVTMIKMRDFLHSVQHVNKNDGKARPLAIQIMVDNEHGKNEALHPLAWNDEEQYVIAFSTNSFDFQTASLALGTSKPVVAGAVTCIQYMDIQQLQAVIEEEDLNDICSILKTKGLMTDDMIENTRLKIFTSADPAYYIKQRQNMHY